MNTQRQEKMVLHAKVGVAGRYRLRVGKRGQESRIDTGWFDNIITDAGLNFMGANDGYMNACQVGSGTATPTVGDTALASFVAGTTEKESIVRAAQSSSPWYGSTTITYRFAEGEAAGNLSEVGIGNAATAGTLLSRARITDGAGSPTTITVLADEFLDVTYQLQLVPPTTDTTFNVTDSGPDGTVHAVTLRAARVDEAVSSFGNWTVSPSSTAVGEIKVSSATHQFAYDGAIGTIDNDPSGLSDTASSTTTDAYVNNSLERTGTVSFALSDGNFAASIKSLRFFFANAGTWQAEFDPVIPKTNTKTLNFDLKVSWTRTTAL